MVARLRFRSRSHRRSRSHGGSLHHRRRRRHHRGMGLGLAGGNWKTNARNAFRSVGRVLKRGFTAGVPALVRGLASGQDPRAALMSAGMAGLKGAVGMGRHRRRRRHTRK